MFCGVVGRQVDRKTAPIGGILCLQAVVSMEPVGWYMVRSKHLGCRIVYLRASWEERQEKGRREEERWREGGRRERESE